LAYIATLIRDRHRGRTCQIDRTSDVQTGRPFIGDRHPDGYLGSAHRAESRWDDKQSAKFRVTEVGQVARVESDATGIIALLPTSVEVAVGFAVSAGSSVARTAPLPANVATW
jgi:hypothetical protein